MLQLGKAWRPVSLVRCKTTLIMGPPGGGKGTISKKLIKDFNFHHISTGDLLRTQVRLGTPQGLKAKSYMESGDLVPDELIIDMVLSKVEDISSSRVLLDGFPRTRVQAEALDKKKQVEIAINLAVPNEEIVRRTSSRWIHPGSGRTYAYDYNPPKEEGKDDETGESLIQRDDDKPAAVKARLQEYDNQTLPLLDYYKEKGCLRQFDGSDNPDLVAKDRRSDAIYASLKPFMQGSLG
ncbi:unnamed protein product [Effrenium voratum]|uniref:Adenylate kinase active site lid domain-containing protein n=1 Tax=Effrenium voratum TaxID=2562239 RepID=A0AA36JEE2_9DINO|nr:unnamed protein product [Effrenium voratum]|mmetsp:Transcript_7077/g.16939  ORF Transcript_7077/g.16939 Transcript_7077/m.16939 type:complete len:237 (+) Transcript_7077:60-770(+)